MKFSVCRGLLRHGNLGGINLMEQKYSNSFNIEFTKSEESVIEIINNNIIQFLLDKSFTYFTWININNKYNKDCSNY